MKQVLISGAVALVLGAGAAMADRITVASPWLSPESEVIARIFALFEERTGHTVSHVGLDSFEQQIVVDAEAGSPPNIAVFPQPGLAAYLASRGFLTPLRADSVEWIRDHYAARAGGADRPDRCRWRHALVYRSGLGRGDRLACNRLGRGYAVAQPAARGL